VGLCRVGLGKKGIWWELDENKRILTGNVTDGNKRIFLGTWWEQKDFDGLLMKTRGIWWELFGTWWEQKDFDKLLKGTVWELDRKSSPYPFKTIRNAPWGHVCTTQLPHPFKK
jgi:hypothetical protein